MCLHTVFVHPCGHDATNPILTTLCSIECGLGPLPAFTLRHKLGIPYNSANPLMTYYLGLLDSYCWICGTKFEPYSSVDVSAAENIFWHIPEVECNEHLFRPIDWNPADHTMVESQGVQVSPTLGATTSNSKLTKKFSFDDAISEEKAFRTVHTMHSEEQSKYPAIDPPVTRQDFFEQIVQPSIKSRFERQARPLVQGKLRNRRLSSLRHTAQIPTLTLLQMRKLDKMSHRIEQELESACAANGSASLSAGMNFDQRIWKTAGAKPPLYTSFSTEDKLLQPPPLSFRHAATPEHVQDLMVWSYEASDVLARGELLLQNIESQGVPSPDWSVYSSCLNT